MKKIICGIVIAMCLCASVFSAPKAKDLEAKGIEAKKGDDGSTYYVYSEMNEPIVGKRYMLLNENHKKTLEGDGSYHVMLFEVVSETDENAVKVDDEYIRHYPIAGYWITDSSFELGKIITFKSVEDIFGKNAFVPLSWTASGWATQDPDLKIWVYHSFQNNNVVDKTVYDKKGITKESAYDGTPRLVYSALPNLEDGKIYMCLSESKEKSISKDKNGFYGIYFYEVVDKSHPDAYKVGSKFVTSYPIACVWAKPSKKIKIPAEITFDGNIKFLFDMNWDIDATWSGWGWSTKDTDLEIWVAHRYNVYRLYER